MNYDEWNLKKATQPLPKPYSLDGVKGRSPHATLTCCLLAPCRGPVRRKAAELPYRNDDHLPVALLRAAQLTGSTSTRSDCLRLTSITALEVEGMASERCTPRRDACGRGWCRAAGHKEKKKDMYRVTGAAERDALWARWKQD
jgi:hypothetical protein